MTLVVRGSGFGHRRVLVRVGGDGLVLHPAVRRPRAVDRDDVQPGGEPALLVPGADLLRDLDQRLLAGVLGVAGVGQHAAADGERARPDRAEQHLERVAVAVLGAARELVDVVRLHGMTIITGCPCPSDSGGTWCGARIGSGAFATVWLAYDEQLDSPVAVKVLADNWTEDAHIRKRFQEEGRYLRKVESPHVVSVYDAGELDDGRPYLVMSYADQGTLADRLEVEGLTVAQAMEVVRQVGAGLQALHDRDIVHRDVKPANVLFRSRHEPGRRRRRCGRWSATSVSAGRSTCRRG